MVVIIKEKNDKQNKGLSIIFFELNYAKHYRIPKNWA